MESNGKLEKVQIHVYNDEDFRTKSSDVSPNPIHLPINPESFSRNFKIEYNPQQGQGNQSSDPEYKSTAPEELKLDFIFDGTNTIQGYKLNNTGVAVKEQLKVFLDAVYNMNGEIHRPHFLKVHWGEFVFSCILTNLDLNYTLFNSSGDPLRIKASATFLNYVAQKERVAREGKRSPDLTHIKLVKAGDRLDNMTHKIYNNVKYVTQIAKANGLTSFRNITPGQELIFPPLDKTNS